MRIRPLGPYRQSCKDLSTTLAITAIICLSPQASQPCFLIPRLFSAPGPTMSRRKKVTEIHPSLQRIPLLSTNQDIPQIYRTIHSSFDRPFACPFIYPCRSIRQPMAIHRSFFRYILNFALELCPNPTNLKNIPQVSCQRFSFLVFVVVSLLAS